MIAEATLLACVLELVVRPVGPDMICVPFTLMPETNVDCVPENVMVETGAAAVVITGVRPPAVPGPVTVTVLPETDAL